MNKEPVEVELHLKGKRYKRALEKCKLRTVTVEVVKCVCVCVRVRVCVFVCVFTTADNAGQMTLFEEKMGKRKKAQGVREEVDDGLEEEMEVEVREGEEREGEVGEEEEREREASEAVLAPVEEDTDTHKAASSRGRN